ncbi:MAG: hypothetical protein M5R40_20505 [Anaerolineae bacterium]|nr:hypothetical protein [Anaerolineae bacterium]
MAFYTYDDASYFAELYAQRLQPLLGGVIRSLAIARTLRTPRHARQRRQRLRRRQQGHVRRATSSPGAGGEYAHTLATWSEDFTVPAWDNGERAPHWEDADVSAFFDLMVNAEAEGFPANPCDRRGAAITSIARAYQRYRS